MSQVYFIAGIDTGVGKTFVTGMLARFLLQRAKRTATVKMVQTGCHNFSEDLEMHRRIMGVEVLPEDAAGYTAPQIFDFPASPHLAAKLEHRVVDPAKITAAVRQVSSRYDVTLVEGVGGLMVPLTEELLAIDFAARQKWPFILVCSGKLGALNHAILSIEAIARRKIPFAGVVYNYCPATDPVIGGDTQEMIRKYLTRYGLPGVVVSLGKVDPTAPCNVDFFPLFQEVFGENAN